MKALLLMLLVSLACVGPRERDDLPVPDGGVDRASPLAMVDAPPSPVVAPDAAPVEVAPPRDAAAADLAPPPPDAPAPAPDAPIADARAAEPDLGPPPPDAGGIWRPAPGTTWQWQLSGTIDTSLDVTMYDVDLFDAPAATLEALRARGRIVICYLSAGSHENWRSDQAKFPAAAIGKPLDGWPGERWLDVRSEGVRAVMKERFDLAVARKCHGVEPDNIDGYANDSGFPLTAADQLDYNRFLAREAHARGLSIGLKNDLDQVVALEKDFDWALNEECVQYDECPALTPFIRAGKAVFHVEYVAESMAQRVCGQTRPLQFSTLIKKLNLDAWRVACP